MQEYAIRYKVGFFHNGGWALKRSKVSSPIFRLSDNFESAAPPTADKGIANISGWYPYTRWSYI